MPVFHSLTVEQRAAVTATGRSVIVSAAAGSGKTRVLAERCAYLVCDAPPKERCDVDHLLVLTFTDAAAAEMRSRIVEAIRTRRDARPDDDRLSDQLLRAEAAQISTIHSFCLWIIRRWFDQAGVDPMVTILDAEEASALKRQVLEALFERRYSQESDSGALLGEDLLNDGQVHNAADGSHSQGRFTALVDVYGLGQDAAIADMVLRLYEFTTSLPHATEWLDRAVEGLAIDPNWAIEALVAELKTEFELHKEHCAGALPAIHALGSCCRDHAVRVEKYSEALSNWLELLSKSESPSQCLDEMRGHVSQYAFEKVRAGRDLTEDQKQARVCAKEITDEVKKLFDRRIREPFGYFAAAEWLAAMATTAPFVSTLVELVREFSTDYAAHKRRMNVLDFSDLERVAFDLVCGACRDDTPPVSGFLRDRFEHVLVDEFQDINPIQQAIIEGVSREQDQGRVANLFAVGDVKQSIYRFRLAEPEIFLRRLSELRSASNPRGVALFLQNNFRSAPLILDAVNACFRVLMKSARGGLTYDAHAELHAPAGSDPGATGEPVEVHLLESRMNRAAGESTEDTSGEGDDADDDPGTRNINLVARRMREGLDPAFWDPIEREAYLIGMRIRELTANGSTPPKQRVFGFGDIAILLRSTRLNADRVAAVLTSMGIPTHAEVGGSLMGALEIREVMAALQVLDNVQQDIPLAGVLRSGIFGAQFSEDELIEIRAIDRKAPFHSAVRQYSLEGTGKSLREKLAALLRRIAGFRDEVTRRPLAQVVWKLIQGCGYMAYASGLPNGPQRRANLLKLHDMARGFGNYRKQGLHRFLRVMEELLADDQLIPVAASGGPAANVVRIMSIHHAKGMEFPVVFVAGLGTEFNLGDRSGRMIFERTSRIGLRGIDREKMIEYPTPVHLLAACEVERCAREEELRILYVAMTRARERLILLGSARSVGQFRDAGRSTAGVLSGLNIATARTPLDWLLPVLQHAPQGLVSGMGRATTTGAVFDVSIHDSGEMSGWKSGVLRDSRQKASFDAVASLEALPSHEPLGNGDEMVEKTVGRIHRLYPDLAASSHRATMAASEYHGTNSLHALGMDQFESGDSRFSPRLESSDHQTAMKRGTATHRILQLLDFQSAVQPGGIRREFDRLMAAGLVNLDQLQLVSQEAIAWFVATPLADEIRQAGDGFHRELRFVTTEPLSILDPTVQTSPEDRVLIRGIVDGVLIRNETCDVIDYKTDVPAEGEIDARSELYRPQLEIYARAVGRLWRRPVRACWLVYLGVRRIIEIPLGVEQVPR